LIFLIVGNKGAQIQRFGKNFDSQSPWMKSFTEKKDKVHSFLLAIAEGPLGRKNISEKARLSDEEVKDISNLLLALNLVFPKGDGWATTVPVVTDREMSTIKTNLTPLAQKATACLENYILQIKKEYENSRSSSAPKWENIAHLIVDKFLLDGVFRNTLEKLAKEKDMRKHYTESQEILPVFFLENGKNLMYIGCNWYPFTKNNEMRQLFVLHGTLFNRPTILVNTYKQNPGLHSALFKLFPGNEGPEFTEEEKRIMQELGWIEKKDVLVPVIDGNELRALYPLVNEAGKKAAEEVFENFEEILSSFQKSPYSKFMSGDGDYIEYCYHALMCLIAEQLTSQSLLPPIPNPVPEHFGVFILIGRFH